LIEGVLAVLSTSVDVNPVSAVILATKDISVRIHQLLRVVGINAA
jgi:hypothetical protein